jgi:hypothetical protein
MAEDAAYGAAQELEDGQGIKGIKLSKDLPKIAGDNRLLSFCHMVVKAATCCSYLPASAMLTLHCQQQYVLWICLSLRYATQLLYHCHLPLMFLAIASLNVCISSLFRASPAAAKALKLNITNLLAIVFCGACHSHIA